MKRLSQELETLWKGKWVSVVSPKDHPYEALHEPDVVLVLPIIEEKKVIIREEFCPPYGMKDEHQNNVFYTLISGKIEEGESVIDTALRETYEESGIELLEPCETHVVFENLPICKSTSMRGTLVILFIKNSQYALHRFPPGDGTKYEKISRSFSVTIRELLDEIVDSGREDFLLRYAALWCEVNLKRL